MLKRKYNIFSSTFIDSSIQTLHETVLKCTKGPTNDIIAGLDELKSSVVELRDHVIETERELECCQHNLATETKRCYALQDFLVNELQNSERLESELLKLKELFKATSKERDFFKKMYDSHIQELNMLATKQQKQNSKQTEHDQTGASLNGSNPTAILSQTLLRKYIRKLFNKKYFYGMVIGYTAPYYKVDLWTPYINMMIYLLLRLCMKTGTRKR